MYSSNWVYITVAVTIVLATEKLSAQSHNFPYSIYAQWNWIIAEPNFNYGYYYGYNRENTLRRWQEASMTMNLVLVKKGEFRWLAVDVDSETVPDMRNYACESYDFKEIGGNLTITSIPTDIFPENLANSIPYVSKLNATGLKINQFQRHVFMNAHYLNHLDFSYNNITKVPSKVFELAINLQIINLSHNKIDTIEEFAFDNAMSENITDIYLHDNSLAHITHDIFLN